LQLAIEGVLALILVPALIVSLLDIRRLERGE